MTIAELRKSRGLTQDDAALQLGVKQSYVSRVERGHANPTLSLLRRMALLYQVPVEVIAGSIPDDGTTGLASGGSGG